MDNNDDHEILQLYWTTANVKINGNKVEGEYHALMRNNAERVGTCSGSEAEVLVMAVLGRAD